MNKKNITVKSLSRSLVILIIGILFSSSGYSGLMEEIVVTAQKREQSPNDVSIAITAISGEQMKQLGVETVNDLQDFTPNLSIKNQFGGDMAVFDVRGVSLFSYDSASSAPVATYFDEVVAPYPSMTQGQLFDMQRVEVLRGPQGTLFGKNTTGGAVAFHSMDPSDEFEAGIDIEVGDYDYTKFAGFVSGPLTDTLAARLAVVSHQRDEGYQTNVFTGKDMGTVDRQAMRLTLDWQPSDTVYVNLKLRSSKDESENQGLKLLAPFTVVDTSTFADVLTFGPEIHPGHFDSGFGSKDLGNILPFDKPERDNDSRGASLRIHWDLDNFTIASVTGYDSLDRLNQLDFDGTNITNVTTLFDTEFTAFSQEIRFSSVGENFKWVVGAYYAEDEVEEQTTYDCFESDLCLWVSYGVSFDQKSDTKAIFAHTEWDFAENLKLTVGLRWTDEHREFNNGLTALVADPFGILAGFGYPVDPTGNLTGGLEEDFSSATGILDCLVLGNCPSYAPLFNSDLDDDAFSGKIGIDWFANDNLLVYVNVSRGFKSGGYGGFPASTTQQYEPYDSETLTAYETGFKLTFASGLAQLNTSAFFYDYEDRQVFSGLHDIVFGPLSAYVNAPETELKGFEIELNWSPIEGLDIRQALGYTTGEFKKFVDYDAAAVAAAGPDPVIGLFVGDHGPKFADRGGEDAPGSEVQYSGLIAYRWHVSDGLAARIQIDYGYEDDYQSIYGSSYDLDSRMIWNARVSLMAADDQWQLSLWGRNLGDEEYFTDINFYNEATHVGSVGAPRTWGVNLAYQF